MKRNIITLAMLAISTSSMAHEGMTLNGTPHQLLHAISGDMLVALSVVLLVCLGTLATRRGMRARSSAARSTTTL
jgi:hypothetical protein